MRGGGAMAVQQGEDKQTQSFQAMERDLVTSVFFILIEGISQERSVCFEISLTGHLKF